MSLSCGPYTFENESDVEQKFIYKLLIDEEPIGLGYNDSDIYTKSKLVGYNIGKGKQKYYYPDYLISMRGFPLMVIEAKAPNEELNLAYAEARLYAAEINAKHPHNIVVCEKIIVSNGVETWAGFTDRDTPEYKLRFDEFCTENEAFVNFINFCSKKELTKKANEPYIKARGKSTFITPVSELGGARAQDEEMLENSFGRALVFENNTIFDPQTEEDKVQIVKNAYIPSLKREQHVDPIYKQIKNFKRPSFINTTLISTDKPVELLQKLNENINSKTISHSLMLLIGNRGSGKTTFIRYFKEIVLQNKNTDLSDKCSWIFLNMNSAPVNANEIYNWTKDIVVSTIKKLYPKIDINLLFKDEIDEFRETLGQYIINDQNTYNKEVFNLVKDCLQDKECSIKAYLRYLNEVENKIPIIVLDNCDKRNKEEQLLMFQVAQWIKDNYNLIVILPMRDSTYDNYKNEPPLDTVVKDLVFRIDPADLLKVLQARLEYLCRLKGGDSDSYDLRNGFRVKITKDEQVEYFRSILMSIRNDNWAKTIFYQLSNKDTRYGIQLFEDLCKSGHINSEEIFKVRTLGENYKLPNYKIMNALLRKNRKYFNEDKSNFANLFSSNYNDDFPDPFVRIDILSWLKEHRTAEGPNKVIGYHKVSSIIKDLQSLGHNEKVIFRETNKLVEKGLILSESQLSTVTQNDLIKLSLSGSLHLGLLKNVSYLGACAEAVIYKNSATIKNIASRIANSNYLNKSNLIATAKDMLVYLQEYKDEFMSYPQASLKDNGLISFYDLNDSIESLSNVLEFNENSSLENNKMIDELFGSEVLCEIKSKENNSLLCVFNNNVRGFLANTENRYNLASDIYNSLSKGDLIICKVLEFDDKHNSYKLEFVES